MCVCVHALALSNVALVGCLHSLFDVQYNCIGLDMLENVIILMVLQLKRYWDRTNFLSSIVRDGSASEIRSDSIECGRVLGEIIDGGAAIGGR